LFCFVLFRQLSQFHNKKLKPFVVPHVSFNEYFERQARIRRRSAEQLDRRVMLVDHSPGIEAAFRRRESAHRRRYYSRLSRIGALPGT